MIAFLIKYFPGSIYVNQSASAISEICAAASSSIIYKKLGVKKAYMMAFGLALIGSLSIIAYEVNTGFYDQGANVHTGWIFPFFVLVGKFGITVGFTINY